MLDILEIFVFALFAAVKFAIVVPVYIIKQELTFLEALLFGVSSGTFGILFFMYVSKFVLLLFRSLLKAAGIKNIKLIKPRKRKKRKVFSKKSRRIVKIKLQYGLPGIAFLTPILLSIPIGTFIAVRYYKATIKTFLFLFAGIVLWSVIFTLFASWILQLLQFFHLI